MLTRWLIPDLDIAGLFPEGAGEGGSGGSGGGSGGSGGEGSGSGADGGAGHGEDGGSGAGDGGPGPGAADFKPPATQAELDALVNTTVTERFNTEFGKRKSKWEQDVKAYLDAEGKKAGMEGDAKTLVEQAEKAANEKLAQADQRIIQTEAKVAAVAAGAKADRVGALLKLADLSDVKMSDDGNPDPATLKAAMERALTENPEFRSGQNGNGQNGASGGEFNQGGQKKTWTRDEISKLSLEEYEKHEPEILAQLQAGGIK